tara:strand:- start:3 stop:296 length:294 start_codon:yes stop_codon:yes gene_type:complete
MSPCDKCKNLAYHDKTVTCLAGHKPRFHMPKNELDSDYGWKKRNCHDYAMKPEDGRDECLRCQCGSVSFHLLRNGNAECKRCQATHERRELAWIYIG